ncbi:translation initiation factor sui1-like protein [Blastocystis sp. ATCC 50177/Nand II]|uniref:Translation initiation factor sui1-like protein n=1 Tax=Blastocystis sp. subtype 1 (strain ATCC 50177 / NandII) TaxID=478820 RepID=A0A196SDY8_BLAHN|nr:translation initiation factor sui1-like protein [Blastocystis sp. ATCC 50177/Nand II]
MTLMNMGSTDAFDNEITTQQVTTNEKVHILSDGRGEMQGLATDLNLKLILKTWKRSFTCNGAIVDDEEHGKIIQLQGDQRTNVRDFLVNEEINRKEDIIVHGF